MKCFKVLPGLPSSGPMYIPFSATGLARFSEGLVVEFQPPTGDSWVGNFAKGLTQFSIAMLHPNGEAVVVVSGGQGYVVDPITQALVNTFGGQYENAIAVPERQLLLFQSPFDFIAVNPSGRLWETRRLAVDGFRSVRVDGGKLIGEASEIDDTWTPFEIDLGSGKVNGGSRTYP